MNFTGDRSGCIPIGLVVLHDWLTVKIVRLCRQTKAKYQDDQTSCCQPRSRPRASYMCHENRKLEGFSYIVSVLAWTELAITISFTRHSALLYAACRFLGKHCTKPDVSHVAFMVNVLTMWPRQNSTLTVRIQRLIDASYLETRQCPVVSDVAQLDRESLAAQRLGSTMVIVLSTMIDGGCYTVERAVSRWKMKM